MSDEVAETAPEVRITELERRIDRYLVLNRVIAGLAGLVVAIALTGFGVAVFLLFSLTGSAERLECRERLAGMSDTELAGFLSGIAKLAADDPTGADGLPDAASRARTAARARALATDPCRAVERLDASLD